MDDIGPLAGMGLSGVLYLPACSDNSSLSWKLSILLQQMTLTKAIPEGWCDGQMMHLYQPNTLVVADTKKNLGLKRHGWGSTSLSIGSSTWLIMPSWLFILLNNIIYCWKLTIFPKLPMIVIPKVLIGETNNFSYSQSSRIPAVWNSNPEGPAYSWCMERSHWLGSLHCIH